MIGDFVQRIYSLAENDTIVFTSILTIWGIIWGSISAFFHIKADKRIERFKKEIKTNKKEIEKECKEHISIRTESAIDHLKKELIKDIGQKASETVLEFENEYITMLRFATDLSMEWGQIRSNIWREMGVAIFAIIEEPSLNIDNSARDKLKAQIDTQIQKVYDLSMEYSYLLQLLDKNPSSREVSRGMARANEHTSAIRDLQIQLDSAVY